MKKLLKNNIKLFVGIIIGLVLAGTTVYAATIYYQGSNVGYDNSATQFKDYNNQDVEDVQTALDELYHMASNCSSRPDTPFELGNYFKMVPDYSGSFTITSGTTGYTSDQTITPSELTLWRVIDIHSDGSVDAVSEYVSSTNVFFQGITGYANYVGGLQIIAAKYAKVGYTINTRMMGYGGQTAFIQPKSSNCTGICQTTTTYAFDGSTNSAPGTTSTPLPTTGIGQEYGGGVLGDTLYLKDIQLVGNVYKTDISTYGEYGLNAYKVNATTTSGNYWLASRYLNYYNPTNFNLYGLHVDSGSLKFHYGDFRDFYNGWVDISNGYSIRPIITLKSGIQISGGSGTKASPYTITG